VQAGQGDLYIPAQLISSNNGWHDGWFYLRNDDDYLPSFSINSISYQYISMLDLSCGKI
jgi:hypothetical protein